MKGIALELPFVKFRYVKVDNAHSDESIPSRQISTSVPSEERLPAVVSAPRMIITRQAEYTTLGLDPMVSSASVIHELTYGRIEPSESFMPQASYPAPREYSQPSLDVVV